MGRRRSSLRPMEGTGEILCDTLMRPPPPLDGEARQRSHGVRKEENVNLYGTQGDSAADLRAI